MNNLHITRDKTHVQYQTKVATALSALGSSLNVILEREDKIPKEIRGNMLASIADSGRILCHLFHEMSSKRRHLIYPLMNKQIKTIVEKLPPGEFLFGPNLGEKIQAIKTMEKVGKELRPSQPIYPRHSASSSRSSLPKRGGG